MNKTVSRLLVLAGMCLALTACNEQPKQRIGIIDEEKVLSENAVAKAAGQHLEKFGLTFEPEIMAMQEEYQKSPEDKEVLERLNQRFAEIQQIFGAEQQQVSDKVNDLYRKAQATVMKSKGLDLLLSSENVLQYDSALDVTELLVAEMNKENIEFAAPAPATAPAMAPASAPAAKEAAPVNGTAPAAKSDSPTQPAANGTAPAGTAPAAGDASPANAAAPANGTAPAENSGAPEQPAANGAQ